MKLALAVLFSLTACSATSSTTTQAHPDAAVADFAIHPPPQDFAAHDFAMILDAKAAVDLAVPDLQAADLAPPDMSSPGCQNPPAVPSLMLVAGTAQGLLTASYDAPSATWQMPIVDGSLVPTAVKSARGSDQRPLVLAHLSDDHLAYAFWDRCSGALPALSRLGNPFSAKHIALTSDGNVVDLLFQGSGGDLRLYHAQFDGTAWSDPVAQSDFLSDLAPAPIWFNHKLHVFFTGTNYGSGNGGKIYDGSVADTVGGGSALALYDQNGITADSRLPPTVIVDPNGILFVFFVGMDHVIYVVKQAPGLAAEAPINFCALNQSSDHCIIDSDLPPAAVLDGDGRILVAWQGRDNRAYFSDSNGYLFSTPTAIANLDSDADAQLRDLSGGILGDYGELVYLRKSGVASHLRLSGTLLWSASQDLPGSQVITIAPSLSR